MPRPRRSPTRYVTRFWRLVLKSTKPRSPHAGPGLQQISDRPRGRPRSSTPGWPRGHCRRHTARNRWFVDSPQEGTGFELPVRGHGASRYRPCGGTSCRGRVGASSQFSDRITPCGSHPGVCAMPGQAAPKADSKHRDRDRSPAYWHGHSFSGNSAGRLTLPLSEQTSCDMSAIPPRHHATR